MISGSVLPRTGDVSSKVVEKNHKTHVSVQLLSFENCAVYEIIWKILCRAGQARDDNMALAHYVLVT